MIQKMKPLTLGLAAWVAGLCAPLAGADVAAIVAQFPANDATAANALFEALLDEGDDAIEGLCDQL